MRLTAATIRTLTLPEGARDKVFFDEDVPGFGLRLRATGAKTWLVQYAIHGRTRRISFGSPSVLDPGKAREAAKDVLARVRLGKDPASEKQRERAQAGDTMRALLPRFLERQRQRVKPRSFVEINRHLVQHAKPLHMVPVAALDRRTVAIRLSEIAEMHGPSAANRVRGSLSAFCTWCAKEGYIESNVVSFTNRAVEGGPRTRLLADFELAAIWNALADDEYSVILKLLLLTGTRRDEIASLRWSEIDHDKAIITLPPERTKNRREHLVPLSEPALTLLAAQARRTERGGTPSGLIFGTTASRGFQNWHKCKRALDQRIASMRGRSLDHWTPHDFRRVVSTTMHERLGVPPHIVEVILSHVNGHKAGIAAVYNRATYENEKRIALERWADHLLAVVEGGERTVVPLRVLK